jgi:hypothetical protein
MKCNGIEGECNVYPSISLRFIKATRLLLFRVARRSEARTGLEDKSTLSPYCIRATCFINLEKAVDQGVKRRKPFTCE